MNEIKKTVFDKEINETITALIHLKEKNLTWTEDDLFH